MKRWIAILFIFFTINSLRASPAVTYTFSGGRFGDNLLAYLHAKWLSYRYQIPLQYRSFRYSSELIMDQEESSAQCPLPVVYLDRSNYSSLQTDASYLYVCPYFAENPWDPVQYESFPLRFDVDWTDPAFRAIARKMIAPKQALDLMIPSTHTVNIALHFREGGGYDGLINKLGDPLKFPPVAYYRECLLEIASLFRGKSIYCYVFTDAAHPESIVMQLQSAMPSECPIVFDYRKTGNYHAANVLEDFFSLFHFDILIRSQSNFSTVASLLHDYAIDYFPTHCVKHGPEIHITQFSKKLHPDACALLEQRID
jgi:hypothetical protein